MAGNHWRVCACVCRLHLAYRCQPRVASALQRRRTICLFDVAHSTWSRPHYNLSALSPHSRIGWHGGSVWRWFSSGSNSEGGRGRKGFFENFLQNLRKGLENKEMQESLKGFHEERAKLEKSYWLQFAKEKLSQTKEMVVEYGRRGAELARGGWRTTREASGKMYKEASETEIAKKGQDIGAQIAKSAQETMEKVSEHAEELSKTDVGQTISKGATVVKEELLDDIIKESAPYSPPEKIQKRSEMASSTAGSQRENVIEPNEEAKEMVLTRQSRWREQWQRLRENNPITNAFYSFKMQYDESDNLVVRASRAVTDRMGGAFSARMSKTAKTLAEIRKIDPTFDKEEFVKQCHFEIIPTVLEAFLRGDLEVLKDWCHEAAFSVLSTVIEQRREPGVQIDYKVLDIRDVNIFGAQMLEQGPVMLITFQAQQLTIRKSSEEGEGEEILENIYYVWALCRDQAIYDPKAAWRVLEFGIQSAGKMLV